MFVDYWPTPANPVTTMTVAGESNSSLSHTDEQQQEQEDEDEQSTQLNKQELIKWVTRSTRGAFIIMSLFITWIVIFQLNKDTLFSPAWLVMDETDAELSGW